jgi:hypothetical protein
MLKEDMKSVDTQPGETGGRWVILTARNGKTTVAWQKDRLLVVAFETAQPDPAREIIAKIAKNLEPKKKEAEQKEAG